MYRIIKIDGTELGITDSVNYIRYGDGGCFTTATRKDAIGVAFKSVAYNLVGMKILRVPILSLSQRSTVGKNSKAIRLPSKV